LCAIILDRVGESLVAEHRTVEFMFWEVTKIVVDVFGGNFYSFVEGFTFGELRQRGSRGDGRGAAVGFPADVLDFVVFNLDVHLHLVAANWVANHADRVKIELEFIAKQEIAWIHKVILHGI